MKYSLTILTLGFSFFLSGCASYIVSTTSLSEQLNGNEVNKGYLLAHAAVKGNELKTIKCLDKNGREKEIPVTNRTGVRITRIDNSKTTFYFNTLLIKDSAITGSKTHFFNAEVTPIKISEISKIEIME